MKKNTPLVLIFLTVFIDLLGFGILIPILPTFSTIKLNVSEFYIGIVIAIYSLTQFLFNPLVGKISDKYGRRPVILWTLLLNGIGYLIFSFTNDYLTLLISRIIAGIGGSNIGVAQAYIADVTTKENRAKGMGLIGAAFGLGFVFGPPLGGFLSEFGYEFAGYASASFSFIALIGSFFYLPESLKEKQIGKIKKRTLFDFAQAKKILTQPGLGLLIILFFVITFSVANVYGTFALLGNQVYNFTDLENGYLFGLVGIISAIMQGWLLKYISRIANDKKLIITGSIFMTLGLGLIPYGGNFTGVALISVLLAIGTGIIQPIFLSLISKTASETEQGAALGINQSFSALARVFGPFWAGYSFQYLGYEFPFLTGAFFSLLILLFALIFMERKIPVTVENKNINQENIIN